MSAKADSCMYDAATRLLASAAPAAVAASKNYLPSAGCPGNLLCVLVKKDGALPSLRPLMVPSPGVNFTGAKCLAV